MVNRIIYSKRLSELNTLIMDYNKEGWVVKQFFVCGDDSMFNGEFGYYALIEKEGVWKSK